MGHHIWMGRATLALLGFVAIAEASPPGESARSTSIDMMVTDDASKVTQQSISDEALTHEGRFVGNTTSLKRGVVLLTADETKTTRKHTAKLPVGRRGAMIAVETLSVRGGRADVILPPKPSGGVLLESSQKIQTIVTAGRATVIERGNKVIVGAIHSNLLVGKSGRFKTLLAGTLRIFDTKRGTVFDRPILKAPTAHTGGLSVSLSDSVAVSFSATPIHKAKLYRTVLLDSDGVRIEQTWDSQDPTKLQLKAPHAGTFWAVVRAVDEYGVASEPSAPLPIKVLGLQNGKDIARHGMIFLSPGQSAKIVGQEGLVMRYGTSPEFIPAPQSISLPGRKATTVEFRDPGDPKKYAIFKLAPRLLKTSIQVGPALGVWPRDDINILIKMWDGHGHPLAWMDEYQIIVKVGVDEVPVSWERSNGQLTTTLSAQNGTGPWVVRVSIIDSTGSEIGRNFLEVIAPPPKKKRLASAK